MIKILDFLYYFIFQLNRRGYKTNNYENARFGLGGLFCLFLIFIGPIIDPLTMYYFENEFIGNNWIILSIIISFRMSYYLTAKYYSINGTRNWVVSEFDKKYTIRKQNSIVQVIILIILLVSIFVFCFLMGIRI